MIYLSLGCMALLALCLLPMADAAGAEAADNPVVVLDTNMGPITIELDRDKAPISVENFLKYVDSGFYNGLCFHRVIPSFMLQGGGFAPDAKGQKDQKQGGAPIKNEGGNGLKNVRGTLAMARTGDPDSATAQFFINLKDNDFLNRGDPSAVDRFGYAVFGKVIDGMDTVDKIAQVPTVRNQLSEGCPTQPVVIKSAKRKAAP
jgi:peptidyl-prolyl cis-trans isomerase A (cyclophilin A)